MQSLFRRYVWLLGALAAGAVIGVDAVAATLLGGLTPQQRPEGAPVVSTAEHERVWWLTALQGIDRPIPSSLGWLKDQGAWYTPFNHPGMTGRYDLRGWHRPAAGAAVTTVPRLP